MDRKIFVIQGVLQIFIGISAVFGGLSLVIDPTGEFLNMPLVLLAGTPFKDFLIPGLILLAVNGIGNVIGSFETFRRKRYAGQLGLALGIVMIIWIAVQVAMIGFASWLQPFYLLLGILEAGLGFVIYKVGNMK